MNTRSITRQAEAQHEGDGPQGRDGNAEGQAVRSTEGTTLDDLVDELFEDEEEMALRQQLGAMRAENEKMRRENREMWEIELGSCRMARLKYSVGYLQVK